MNVLTVHDISKRYGKQQALDHVSFSLESGHIYGFVGNNGAGKTTLFRILAGLVTPNSGSITLLGASTPKELRAARRKVGFLLPRESFSADLTALQNLMAFQRLRGYHDQNEAMELLTKVGLDEDHARRRKLQSLSTGEFQRVAIAAVQLGHPELLVLDEPQNGLDPAAVHEFRASAGGHDHNPVQPYSFGAIPAGNGLHFYPPWQNSLHHEQGCFGGTMRRQKPGGLFSFHGGR